MQVKTRDQPGTEEAETIRQFPCQPNCRKLIHRRHDRLHLPAMGEVCKSVIGVQGKHAPTRNFLINPALRQI